ncbi:MAG: GAF domain-containing sensor histidine kinase [Cyanobacteria bacterium Co-bin13]|nr:GAF domain-containing sensor histidine kinase [Cyanobacteria bacterium Co-bin13]
MHSGVGAHSHPCSRSSELPGPEESSPIETNAAEPLGDEDRLKQSEAKFRELARQNELLYQVSKQIRQSLQLDQILQTTVCQIRCLLETDRVLIYRFGDNWQGQVVIEDVIPPWRETLGQMGADSCFPEGYAELYGHGYVRAIEDIETAGLDACHVEYLKSLQVRSNLIVPILVRNQLWGLLIAHHCCAPRRWRESETELLQALAEQVGVAIRQADLYEQATKSARLAHQQATQLEMTLQRLKKTQAQLVQTEKMSSLGQLVAGIAHEINNPVNFIYGNVGYLKTYIQDLTHLVNLYQTHYPEPVQPIADQIETMELDFMLGDLQDILKSYKVGSDRIRQIVLSLRTFSRLDEADMKAVDIHEGIDSTLLLLQHRLRDNRQWPPVQLHKHYGTLPLVECYPSQLNQVFLNILTNAFDVLEQQFSEQNDLAQQVTPEITIVTEVKESYAFVRIRDNGPGIPPEIRSRLFDPFFTTKPAGQGTGLGLSISHQIIVEAHGGRLLCHSTPEEGTEFCVVIPLQQAQVLKSA